METVLLGRKKTKIFHSLPKEKPLTYEIIGEMMAKTTPFNHTPILGFTAEEQAEFDSGISIQNYAEKRGVALI
jgi:hypothetical protein